MTLVIEEVPSLYGYAVEWADGGTYYLSRRNVIYRSEGVTPPFTRVATIGAPAWKAAASRSRLLQRMLRFMVTNLLVLPNGDLFVTFDKTVGVIKNGTFTALSGMARPCRALRSACAIDPNGDIFFGEYRLNRERDEVNVYRYSPGSDAVEIVYTFAAGSIAHVHGLYFDDVARAMYCLSGDDAEECKILRSVDGCRSFYPVGECDETWRAVSMVFGERFLFYGTDASFRPNHIYRMDRTTLARSIVGGVDGPVLFSQRLGDDFVFSTSAEAAPSQVRDVASLWRMTEGAACERLVSYQKDRWPHSLFKLGTIHFPTVSTSKDELFFHLVAVTGDNRTFRIVRAAQPSASERRASL